MTIRGGRRVGGDEGSTKLKANVISATAERVLLRVSAAAERVFP